MDSSNINIFESFSLTSILMPYFAPTHKSFLLLSTLCKKSRYKLNEYYEEFRKIMLIYSLLLMIQRENINRITLPSDLFRFKIKLNTNVDVDIFIQFIINISNKEGYFFNDHFMHNQLWIVEVLAKIITLERLNSYAKYLKSVVVIDDERLTNDLRIEQINLSAKLIIDQANSWSQSSTLK